MNVAIANHGKAVGKYLPARKVYNPEIAATFARHGVLTSRGEPLTAEWMEEHVGLKKRHWAAEDEYADTLGIIAANRALQNGKISPFLLDTIRVASSSIPMLYPGLSCLIQNGLVAKGQSSLHLNAFDISVACTGGIQALVSVAENLLCQTDYQYGLAVAAETMSKVTDPTQSNFQVWGDGAAAFVLEKTTKDRGLICSIFESSPEHWDKTESRGLGAKYLGQDVTPDAWFNGSEVQKFVIRTIISLIPRMVEKANRVYRGSGRTKITIDDIKFIATHQANARIWEKPAKELGIPGDKFFVNFPEYANTSSASNLLCLVDMIEQGLVQEGDLVMLIGFGGGLTDGAVLWRI